ncbi:MAG: PKD-like domain-containing protein, partial [Mucinivorans sp.]
MVKFLHQSAFVALCATLAMGILLTACHQNQREYVLAQEDIKVHQPPQGFVVKVGQLLRIEVKSVSDEGVTYKWLLDNKEVSSSKNLEYMIETIGEFQLKLEVKKGQNVFDYHYKVIVDFDQAPPTPSQATAYITKVFDYLPAVGQFTNTLPEYVAGDTQQTMNKKVLDAIGNNHTGMIALGGC